MVPVLLTPVNVMLRKAYPWAYSVQKLLNFAQPHRFLGSHMMFGSDYSGQHRSAKYDVYCFLIADETPDIFRWSSKRHEVRKQYMSDGRRMSFKRLGDAQRQEALVPFLQAADAMTGHLVAVLVHKKVRFLTTHDNTMRHWSKALGLSGRWNVRAFENMARKAHFFALCVAQWSSPGSHITWITDEDEFVANDARLNDAQIFASKLSAMYVPHSLGIFAMNSTAKDEQDRVFEDFVAIPDLAAGMLSELCSALELSTAGTENAQYELHEGQVTAKSVLISDWFWFPSSRLRRTCIVIDKVGDGGRVRKLDRPSYAPETCVMRQKNERQ